jgi:hypothetical protein
MTTTRGFVDFKREDGREKAVLGDSVPVAVGVSVCVEVPVGEADAVGDTEGERLRLWVGVRLAVTVGDGVPVAVPVMDRVPVGVAVGRHLVDIHLE